MICDLIWILCFNNIWNSEPKHDEHIWKSLHNIRSLILMLSLTIILLRAACLYFLYNILKIQEEEFQRFKGPSIRIESYQ